MKMSSLGKKVLSGILSLSLGFTMLGGVGSTALAETDNSISITVGESYTFEGNAATVSNDGVLTIYVKGDKTTVTGRKAGTVSVTIGEISYNVTVNAALKSGDGQRAGGTTTNSGLPFSGVPEASLVRIPGIIVLQNGDILICSDMRYSGWPEGGGIDTIVTISHDGGKTWNYQFPIYFADSTDSGYPQACTAIDPICLQGSDGTIYIAVNVSPTGISTIIEEGFIDQCEGRGYVNINGVERLVLTDSWDNAFVKPSKDDGSAYPYYVGDIDAATGYAPILRRSDNTPTKWVVDDALNIYEIDGEDYLQLTQEQYTAGELNGKYVQQNLFFKDSVLHVYNTQYLWWATSTDNGQTWKQSILENIKYDDETQARHGCGHGTIAPNGHLIMPMYICFDNTMQSTLMFSADDGKTWKRAYNNIPNATDSYCSNECETVALSDGTLRTFFRSDGSANNTIMYCDAVWDEQKQNYVFGDAVITDVTANNSTKMTAIRYSKKIDGAEAVMVSYPADPSMRADGKIWTFLLRENNEMELAYAWDFPHYWEPQSYGYSNMTELLDGSIGIICEQGNHYENPSIQEVCPGAVIGDAAKSYPPYADTLSGASLNRDSVVKLRVEENTTVYYTIDGSEPTTESTVYNGGIKFNNSTDEPIQVTLKAIAVTDGREQSRVLEYTYTVSNSNSVVVDFEDSAKYTTTVQSGDGYVTDGKFSYKTSSGWPVFVDFNADSTFSTGTNSAIAFHISVPYSAPSNNRVIFAVKESSGPSYYMAGGATVYLVGDDAIEAATTTVYGTGLTGWTNFGVNIAPGFSGYVVVPTASMFNNTASNVISSVADANGTLNLESVNKVMFSHGMGNTSGQSETYNVVDNITLVYDKDEFIKDNLNKPLTVTPSLQSGSTVKSESELTFSANDKNVVIYYTTDGTKPTTESNVYNGSIILINDTDKAKSVTVKLLLTLENNPSFEYTYTYNVAAENSVILDFENIAEYTLSPDGATAEVIDGELNYKVNSGWGMRVHFNGDSTFIQGENSGLALHIKVPSDAISYNSIVMIVKESTGAGYSLYPGQTVYLVSDDRKTVTEVTVNAALQNGWTRHSANIAPGFSGWLIVPAGSMQNEAQARMCPYVGSTVDDNGQLDLNTITYLAFSHGNGSVQNETVNKVDNLTLVSDIEKFIEGKVDMPLYETIDNYDTTGNTNGEFLKANTKTLVKNSETYLYSGEPLMKIAKYKTEKSALVFWVSVPEETNDTTFKLAINHNGGERYTIGAGKEYYTVTADANRNVSTYTANASQVISFEAGFKGWVVVPYTSFEAMAGWEAATTATLDFSNIRNILFYTLTGGCDMVFDQVGFTGDINRFMTYAPVSLACDVNGDCEVDIRDIIAVKMMLAENAEPNHNPYNADLDGNGTVDVKDIIKMKKRFLGLE